MAVHGKQSPLEPFRKTCPAETPPRSQTRPKQHSQRGPVEKDLSAAAALLVSP